MESNVVEFPVADTVRGKARVPIARRLDPLVTMKLAKRLKRATTLSRTAARDGTGESRTELSVRPHLFGSYVSFHFDLPHGRGSSRFMLSIKRDALEQIMADAAAVDRASLVRTSPE